MVSAAKIAIGDRPRILLVEPEREAVRRVLAATGRECCRRVAMDARSASGTVTCGCGHRPGGPCCTVIGDPSELDGVDLVRVELIIGAVRLRGASGLALPAAIAARRPGLPVLLTGSRDDVRLAGAAIRAGAQDFIVSENEALRSLPMAIEKCLAHNRVKVENDRLHGELNRSLAELESKNRELETLINQLEIAARTDDLTGLANRRWLSLTLEGAWAEAARYDLPLACIMIDLDAFKKLNDTMGHQHGDEILRMAGAVLRANCRTVDVSARYGGDEFCILMPHTEPHEAVLVAERILGAFEEAAAAQPADEPRVGMSIGVAHRHLSAPRDARQLIMHADEALYMAKATGRNRITVRGHDGVVAPMTRG